MNENIERHKSPGTATIIVLSFLLFYFPSVLAIFNHGDEPFVWIMMNIVMSTFYTAIFFINYFWLVPYFVFSNDRKTLFILINVIIIIVICSLVPIWFETHGGVPRPRHDTAVMTTWQHLMGYVRFVIRDGIMMILSVSFAYALKLSQWQEHVRRKELELNAERKQIELKSLKAQLNPHFLFNSLNNIYALIAISPDRAQKALHDLSGMLRYMIYDAASAFVPLEKEMDFIADYVELMKLRLGSNVNLSCNIDKTVNGNLQIAPLLFLTIVENAFKHSGANSNGWYISIDIRVEDKNVICKVTNSIRGDEADDSLTETGVGLANVERQLRLLYPGAFTFRVSKTDGCFTSMIAISCDVLIQSQLDSNVKTLWTEN